MKTSSSFWSASMVFLLTGLGACSTPSDPATTEVETTGSDETMGGSESEGTSTTSTSEDPSTTSEGSTSEEGTTSQTTEESDSTTGEPVEIDCGNAIVVEGDHNYKQAKELCSQGQGVILQGELHIWSLQTEKDLRGLECICGVEGNVEIGVDFDKNGILNNYYPNPSLVSLQGLDHLAEIKRGLYIAHNDGLVDLSGLPAGLTSVGGNLWIYDNDGLVDLIGLPAGLTSVGGNLWISGNAGLVDLIGLPAGLTSVGGDLKILDNDGLLNLSGLPAGLTSIGGSLGIYRNEKLHDLSGLEPLTSIGGHLVIGDYLYEKLKEQLMDETCDDSLNTGNQLTSLGGLDNLESVGGFVVVRCNSKLTALGPFPKLKSVGSKLPELLTPEQAAEFPYAMAVIRNPLLNAVEGKMSIDNVENGTFGIACNAAGFTKEVAQTAAPNATVEEIPNLTCF